MGKRRTLTQRQRRDWATSFAAGVPENVIAEFERDLDGYIDEWTAHLLLCSRDRKGTVTVTRAADVLRRRGVVLVETEPPGVTLSRRGSERSRRFEP